MGLSEEILRYLQSIKYPTKDWILSNPISFKPEAIAPIQQWKTDYFDNKWWRFSEEEKWKTLISLASVLVQIYRKPFNLGIGPNSQYFPTIRTIILHKPSILTLFHEFSHHIHGPSENVACQWSVWLFKTCFPEEYKDLTWKGHLLVRKK